MSLVMRGLTFPATRPQFPLPDFLRHRTFCDVTYFCQVVLMCNGLAYFAWLG